MVDPDVAELRLRRGDFGFAGLKVSRKMRREGGGDLHADAVASLKDIAGEHAIKIEEINLAGSEKLWLERAVSVAGAEDVETGTHQIKGGAVGRDVEQANPKIEVGDVGGDEDFCANRACDFHVSLERHRVEGENIVAASEGTIVMRAVLGIRIC